jgi:hypothetical protein
MQAVHKGVTIDPWAVAVFDARVNDGDRIGFQLMECCNRQGLVRCPVTSSLLRCTMISYIQCLFLIYQLIPPYDFPAGVEKEPPSAQNMPPERRVEQMFAALRKHRPVFILVVLPTDGSNSALYGSDISALSLECISSSKFLRHLTN